MPMTDVSLKIEFFFTFTGIIQMNGTICFKTLDNFLWTAIRGMKTGMQQENVNIHNNTEDQQKNNRVTNIHIAIIF